LWPSSPSSCLLSTLRCTRGSRALEVRAPLVRHQATQFAYRGDGDAALDRQSRRAANRASTSHKWMINFIYA
jgi:hypothetical protein